MSDKAFAALEAVIVLAEWGDPYDRRKGSLARTELAAARELLAAAKAAYEAIDDVYDVDEPSPGHREEYPFSGAGEILSKLRDALEPKP